MKSAIEIIPVRTNRALTENWVRLSAFGLHSSFIIRISPFLLVTAMLLSPGSVRSETNLIVINQSAAPPTVGMEGQLEVALPLAGLITKPGDHRAPLVLRIAGSQPHGTLNRYDLRYAGRVPGSHDLRMYLFTPEGEPATNLPALMVKVPATPSMVNVFEPRAIVPPLLTVRLPTD